MFAGWHPTADHGGIQHVLIAAQQQHLAATFIIIHPRVGSFQNLQSRMVCNSDLDDFD